MIHTAVNKRLSKILVSIGPIASIAVLPTINWDPINPVKLLFIVSAAFYSIFLLLPNFNKFNQIISKKIWISIFLFVLALFSSMIFSGAPIGQQFWGTFGRNTGFVTYFSFTLILISAMVSQDSKLYVKVINSLIATSVFMTIYCLIQIAKLDPVGWSELRPFGTLGNINFSSAFFGLSTLCAFALIFDSKKSMLTRLSLGILIVVDLSIIYYTGSIQGLMMFVAGVGIQGFIYILQRYKQNIVRLSYLFVAVIGVILTILGLANKGPLSKFLFAPSIVFRSDYWHAGWAMTLKFPFFGVGLDSYGDWYRTVRGEISTLRTGPDRTANTAHNIFLDISSNGGFPLILCYLAILFFAFRYGIKVLKTSRTPYQIALFTSWIGFIIFSSISINQVGVGVWGWLFTGLLIGNYKFGIQNLGNIKESSPEMKKVKKSKKSISKNSSMPASNGLFGLLGLSVGVLISIIPLQADAKFKTAMQSGAIDKMLLSVQSIGATAFHKEMVVDVALRNNFQPQALLLARELVKQYPRDFMGWRVIAALGDSTNGEKSNAIKQLEELDPFNPNLTSSK